jgi:hypothetical protein
LAQPGFVSVPDYVYVHCVHERVFCPNFSVENFLPFFRLTYIFCMDDWVRNLGKGLFHRPKISRSRAFCSRKGGKDILVAPSSIQTNAMLETIHAASSTARVIWPANLPLGKPLLSASVPGQVSWGSLTSCTWRAGSTEGLSRCSPATRPGMLLDTDATHQTSSAAFAHRGSFGK